MHFVPTRMKVSGEMRIGSTSGDIVNDVQFDADAGCVRIRWKGTLLPPDGTLRIRIPIEGEHLHGLRFEWLTEHGVELPPASAAIVPALDRIREQFQHRKKLISAMRHPRRGYSEFFCALDHESHPILEPDWISCSGEQRKLRAEAIITLEPLLRARILAKASATHPSTPLLHPPASRDHVQCISGLMLGLMDENLYFNRLKSTSLRVLRIGFAFDSFAAGRLQLKGTTSSHGQPNGANLFCFAEFAFLAIEQGIAKDRWLDLLPALVRIQEVFLLAYGATHGRRAPYDSYCRTPMVPVAQLPLWLILNLRNRYSTMEFDELLVNSKRLARAAFDASEVSTPPSRPSQQRVPSH
jgi:hypothetical protein